MPYSNRAPYYSYDPYQRHKLTRAPVTRVNDPNAAWQAQAPHWPLIEDLIGGTYAMRGKRDRYLPQEPRELDESYNNRLARSNCPPYYQRLERMLAGMLTRKPVRLEEVPDQIQVQMFDVDLQGNDINVWTYETTRKMIRYGHVGVLVDAPSGGGGRPYWVCYTPREILGFRTELVGGRQVLTQLRLQETVTLPSEESEYGEEQVEQVRVLTPGGYQVHRRDKASRGSDFRVVEEGGTSLPFIPFAVAYSNKTAVLESRPPLEDIAELNLKAYQVQSDLDNQLHISAVPMLAFFGFPTGGSQEITAGPGEALTLPPEARAQYIEPSGQSFAAQFDRLGQIAAQINELGLSAVLGQKLTAETAEAKRIDRSQGDSTMMVIAQNVQDMLDNCLRFHALYLGEAQPGSSFVNRDFLGSRLDIGDVGALLQLYTSGVVTKETLLKQLSEGEILGDEFDVEEELKKTFVPPRMEEERIKALQELQAANVITQKTLLKNLIEGRVFDLPLVPDKEIKETGQVSLGATVDKDELKQLVMLYTEGVVTRGTLLERLKAWGILPPDLDVEEEEAALEEAPPQDEGRPEQPNETNPRSVTRQRTAP